MGSRRIQSARVDRGLHGPGIRPPAASPASSPRPPLGLLAPALLALVLPGCLYTPEQWAADADAEVDPLLAEYDFDVLGDREGWVRHPEARHEDETASQSDDQYETETGPVRLDLASALEHAVTTGREFLDRKDTLYSQGLSLTLTRFNFGPLFSSTLDALYTGVENGSDTFSYGADFGVSQILGTGGTLSLLGDVTSTVVDDPSVAPLGTTEPRSYDSNYVLALNQPLLRGAGYEVAWEPLTQSERDLIYQVRDFELFREDFSISIANDYYRLVGERRQLDNLEADYEQAVFDREKAIALRQVDRNQDEDVFLAQRREIDTESNLIQQRTQYKRNVDDFKIRLGLPITTEVEVVEERPEFQKVRLDSVSAVEVALYNRLDLITERQRIEDRARRVSISANGLLPDVDLVLTHSGSGSDRDFGETNPTQNTNAAGLSIEIPLQRKSERNAYRQSLIDLARAERDYQRTLDQVERDVLDQLRELDRLEKDIELQELQIVQERRAVAISEIRWEAGEIENRDLLDARDSLVQAENALIDSTVDHFIARLRLLRELGLLFIEPNGKWRA